MSDTEQPNVIAGFDTLEAEIAETIKTVKASELNVATLWKAIAEHDLFNVEYDLLAKAREHLSIGFILLLRAVKQEDDPFSFHNNSNVINGEVHGD